MTSGEGGLERDENRGKRGVAEEIVASASVITGKVVIARRAMIAMTTGIATIASTATVARFHISRR
jgi:hypothetical protein